MVESVLYTIRYFALFNHPLTESEIFQFLNDSADRSSLRDILASMVKEGKIAKTEDYYHIQHHPNTVEDRKTKEARARAMIEKSYGYTRIISIFPFVRSIAISGSTSKLSAKKNADLDFFIITSPGRLWIARTLLHLFKKLTFLFNQEKFFCMNYFVDSDHLPLPFHNYYTALEIQTLIPVYGKELIDQLKEANSWTLDHLPNHSSEALCQARIVESSSMLKRLMETLFNILAPKQVNLLLMKITNWKWRRKFASLNLSEAEYDAALMTRPYISKNHPHDFQKRVLQAMESKLPVNEIKSVYA